MYKVKRFSLINNATGKIIKGSKSHNKELTRLWKHSHSPRLLKSNGSKYTDLGGNKGVNRFINDRAELVETASPKFKSIMKSKGVMSRIDRDVVNYKMNKLNSNSSKEAYSKVSKIS